METASKPSTSKRERMGWSQDGTFRPGTKLLSCGPPVRIGAQARSPSPVARCASRIALPLPLAWARLWGRSIAIIGMRFISRPRVLWYRLRVMLHPLVANRFYNAVAPGVEVLQTVERSHGRSSNGSKRKRRDSWERKQDVLLLLL